MRLDSTTEGPSQASTGSITVPDNVDKKDPHVYIEFGDSDERTRLLGEGSSSGTQPLEITMVPAYDETDRDSPPEFQPYYADYKTTSSGNICSHDKHLNEDGEALYQFILSRAKAPPKFILKCRGTHPEERTRYVTRTKNIDGRTVTQTERQTYTETIVDFDFAIDVSQHFQQHPPVLWTVPDDEPAYRGRMKREVLTDTGRYQSDSPRRITPSDEAMPDRSELTLRQWADRYCTSNKSMKSFKFRKVVYGWNTEKLAQVVRSSIRAITYCRTPTITVKFITSASEIDIRPPSTISCALSKTWAVFLLWLTLIYPFIWVYKRLRGGRWEVAGSAFPLRTWKHCRDSIRGESAEIYRQRTSKEATDNSTSLTNERSASDGTDHRILTETSNGVSQLIGLSERDWFLTWEPTIKQCVFDRTQRATPIVTPYHMPTPAFIDPRLSTVGQSTSSGTQSVHGPAMPIDPGILDRFDLYIKMLKVSIKILRFGLRVARGT
ncbi:hypothetical protein RHS04_06164 [Rhizoctonia solani]|uniref:Uncharacterized protein n=1 Tax=Rhizoctonia solani TaxID=456999 RepID=A0A8H7H6E9_9AGAM|nr:hypothetical protein RHS04_06164 [Rhizoctonia solani]